MADLFIGTSGFAFKEWKGVFYPEGTSDKKMLAYYSSVLPSVEINYTFRRMPDESTFINWKQQAAGGFRFTLKAPQRITHFKRLADCEEDVAEFVRRARLLGDRLGTILFQLPPNLKYDKDRLGPFLDALPPVARCAMEFRHESFADPEVDELLAANSVARCGADTDEAALRSAPVTASYVYLRLRKQDYAPAELSHWADEIRRQLAEGRDVYCYFKHEGGGIGPKYALSVKEQAA